MFFKESEEKDPGKAIEEESIQKRSKPEKRLRYKHIVGIRKTFMPVVRITISY